MNRHKRSDFCEQTHKVRFRDSREATRRLQSLQNLARTFEERGEPHRIRVVRKYRCPACKGWHLTSWQDYSAPRPVDPLVRNLAAATGLAA